MNNISQQINIGQPMSQRMPQQGSRSMVKALTAKVSGTFGLPETGRFILETLLGSTKAFSVKDLVRKICRSERSVRGALDHLVEKGVIIRKVSLTGRKRLSYLYTIGPLDRIVKVVRSEILNQLETLEQIENIIHERR